MAAKKAPKRAQADQPATEPCGSVEPSTDGEATKTLTPAAETPTPNDRPSDRLRILQLLADTAGRIFHAVTGWLTHEQAHMRVLGTITWLFLLGMVAVVVSQVELGHVLAAIFGLTGVVAGVDVVSRRFRRRR